MEIDDAERLIASVVRPGGSWADLGAGSGTFTRALARLVGVGGTVYAVERDSFAVGSLAALAQEPGQGDRAQIVVVPGDFAGPLDLPSLDGALLANALHFIPASRQAVVLRQVATGLKKGAELVIVEYEDRPASQWVPYPVSSRHLAELVRSAELGEVRIIGSVESRFGGSMYAGAVDVTSLLRD